MTSFSVYSKRFTALSGGEVFEPIMPWTDSLAALYCVSVLMRFGLKVGNFQYRLALQTADDIEAPDTAISPSDGMSGQQGTASATPIFKRWDPNGANGGEIDQKKYFRLGILYSLSTGSTPGAGEISFKISCK